MYIKTLLFLFILISVSNPSNADEASWADNGKPVHDTENLKSKNGFGAQLWLTPNDIIDEWNKPEVPRITVTKQAKRNTPIYVTIMFVNPSVNKEGECDVTGDMLIHQPDGKVYADIKDFKIWKNRPAPPKGIIQLAEGTVAIVIEDKDILGTYTIDVSVKDNVNQIVLPLHYEFIAESS